MEFDAFLSYKPGIYDDLVLNVKNYFVERYDLNVWFNNDSLQPTHRCYASRQRGIESSKFVICFITEQYDACQDCIREITFACNNLAKQPIILMLTTYRKLRNIGLLISTYNRINVMKDLEQFMLLTGESYNKLTSALVVLLGQPIQLVHKKIRNDDSTNEMVLNHEALRVISNIRHNIGACAVVGPYRQGKSFLVNRLLEARKRFQLGHDDIPCTKGIWIWSLPVPLDTSNGRIYCLFVDTEGLDAQGNGQEEWDRKVFMLSLLMSSYFIYNKTVTLDRGSLDSLAAITSLSEKVRISSNPQDLPDMIFVVRDFRLESTMTPQDMLNTFLQLEVIKEEDQNKNNDRIDGIKNRNAIRTQIRRSFRSVSCAYLPTPELTAPNGRPIDENLRHIEDFAWEELRENFRMAMNALCDKIKGEIRGKMINGEAIDGPAYANLLRDFVRSLNSNKIIYMEDSVVVATNIAFKDMQIKAFLKTVDTDIFRIKSCTKFAYGIDREAIDYHIRFCEEHYTQVPPGVWSEVFHNNNDSRNWPSVFRKFPKTDKDDEVIQRFLGRWRRVDPLVSSELINNLVRQLPAAFGLWRWPYYARIFFACEYRDLMQGYLLEYPDLVIEPGFVIYFNGNSNESFDASNFLMKINQMN